MCSFAKCLVHVFFAELYLKITRHQPSNDRRGVVCFSGRVFCLFFCTLSPSSAFLLRVF